METPVGLRYAGFWIRFWAFVIDSVLVLLIIVPLLWATYGTQYLEPADTIFRGPLDFLLNVVFPTVAIITFWVYRSATPGKIVVGARIVDARSGGKPSTLQLVGRYFGYYVSVIPFGLGMLWIAFDRRKQGWHDKLAGTVVVLDKR
jgi:uncharacterized RDD family membrane protein YckC